MHAIVKSILKGQWITRPKRYWSCKCMLICFYVGTREHSLTKLNTNKLNSPYSIRTCYIYIYIYAWYILLINMCIYIHAYGFLIYCDRLICHLICMEDRLLSCFLMALHEPHHAWNRVELESNLQKEISFCRNFSNDIN